MAKVFDQNNAFFRIMGVVFDLVELNLLTVLGCVPTGVHMCSASRSASPLEQLEGSTRCIAL